MRARRYENMFPRITNPSLLRNRRQLFCKVEVKCIRVHDQTESSNRWTRKRTKELIKQELTAEVVHMRVDWAHELEWKIHGHFCSFSLKRILHNDSTAYRNIITDGNNGRSERKKKKCFGSQTAFEMVEMRSEKKPKLNTNIEIRTHSLSASPARNLKSIFLPRQCYFFRFIWSNFSALARCQIDALFEWFKRWAKAKQK